jgi:hypothetical protein
LHKRSLDVVQVQHRTGEVALRLQLVMKARVGAAGDEEFDRKVLGVAKQRVQTGLDSAAIDALVQRIDRDYETGRQRLFDLEQWLVYESFELH